MVENSTKFIALDRGEQEEMMKDFRDSKGYEHDNGHKGERDGRHRELSGRISQYFHRSSSDPFFKNISRIWMKLSGYIRFTSNYCRNFTNIKLQLSGTVTLTF